MLGWKPVVVDFEGFKHKKNDFIIKELSICGDYLDTVYFLPPVEFEFLSLEEKRKYQWLSRFLHGLFWHRGEYPYNNLLQICQSFAHRYPGGTFYAKGEEKCTVLRKLIGKPIENLDTLGCPKVEDLNDDIPHCHRHSKLLPAYLRDKHCAQRKAQIYYDWLKDIHGSLDIAENDGIANSNIRKFERMSLATNK